MDGATLRQEVVAGEKCFTLALEEGQDIDQIGMRMLRSDPPPFLAPVSFSEVNGQGILKYRTGSGISLSYWKETMSLDDLCIFWENLTAPLRDCRDWLLDYRCFCMDEAYVFLDKQTKEVRYLYLPIKNRVSSEDSIKQFLLRVLSSREVTDGLEQKLKLYDALIRMDGLNLAELQSMTRAWQTVKPQQTVPQEEIIPTREPAAREPVVREPRQTVKPKPEVRPPEPRVAKAPDAAPSIEDKLKDMMDGKRAGKEKKPKEEKPVKKGWSLFGSKKEQTPPIKQTEVFFHNAAPIPEPVAAGASPANQQAESVTMYIPADSGETPYLQLQSGVPGLPARIDLDFTKGSFTIGRYDVKKGVRQCDFEFPPDIGLVSRQHVLIESKDGGFVVVDTGSANGTYLNSQPLTSSIPYPMQDGDMLSLSKKISYVFIQP